MRRSLRSALISFLAFWLGGVLVGFLALELIFSFVSDISLSAPSGDLIPVHISALDALNLRGAVHSWVAQRACWRADPWRICLHTTSYFTLLAVAI